MLVGQAGCDLLARDDRSRYVGFAPIDRVDALGNDVQLAALARPLEVTVDLRQASLAHRLRDHRVASLACHTADILTGLLEHRSQLVIHLSCPVGCSVGV